MNDLDPGVQSIVPADPRHGWLPVLLPAAAGRVRVREPELARTLADAGFELVEQGAEAEVGRAQDLVGEAPLAITALHKSEPRARPRALRAIQRVLSAAALCARAAGARRRLRRLGYERAELISWERNDPLVPKHPRGPLAHAFPLNVLVVGVRGVSGPTILQAAAAAAAAAAGVEVSSDAPVIGSSGVVVAVGTNAVLRVALGRARDALELQVGALDGLRQSVGERDLGRLLPALLGSGESARAAWSLEARLPGATPLPPLTPPLLDDCVEFLVALHRSGGSGGQPESAARTAEVVAGRVRSPDAARLRALGERVDVELAGLPRGFGHGDFWSGNLLAEGDRLTGVVDWAAAGPGCLPLLDLLHLRVSELRDLKGLALGPALLRFAADGFRDDDHALRGYIERMGLDLGEGRQAALLAAYWLDSLGRELRDPDPVVQPSDPAWREANVDRVLRALEAALVG